jgi:hypothetical protein
MKKPPLRQFIMELNESFCKKAISAAKKEQDKKATNQHVEIPA